jgi:rod shape-determining protein MreC
MAAQVIGSSGSEQSRSLYIDKGENDGIKPDMAVITADGIVGKVLHAYPSTSLVLLISDQSSGVGAILEKTRLQGILKGTSAGEVALEKVMSDETVPAGEMVLTSGGDGIFPKGLLVGRVTKVGAGSDLFLNIRVRPAADLSRLEEVLVVTKIDERQAQPDQTGAARAVDILAGRLPSVPAKPPENAEKGATPESATPTSPGSDAKPKAVPSPASAGSASPAAVKPTKPAPAAGTTPTPPSGKPPVPKANGSGADAVKVFPKKVSPEPVPPAVAPKPQPPVQDSPQ